MKRPMSTKRPASVLVNPNIRKLSTFDPTSKIGAPIDPDSIRQRVLSMITGGMHNESIVALISETNPTFKMKDASWLRSDFSKRGMIEPKLAPRNSKRFADWFSEINWDAFDEFMETYEEEEDDE